MRCGMIPFALITHLSLVKDLMCHKYSLSENAGSSNWTAATTSPSKQTHNCCTASAVMAAGWLPVLMHSLLIQWEKSWLAWPLFLPSLSQCLSVFISSILSSRFMQAGARHANQACSSAPGFLCQHPPVKGTCSFLSATCWCFHVGNLHVNDICVLWLADGEERSSVRGGMLFKHDEQVAAGSSRLWKLSRWFTSLLWTTGVQNELNWWCFGYTKRLSSVYRQFATAQMLPRHTHTDQNIVIYARFLDDLLPPTGSLLFEEVCVTFICLFVCLFKLEVLLLHNRI